MGAEFALQGCRSLPIRPPRSNAVIRDKLCDKKRSSLISDIQLFSGDPLIDMPGLLKPEMRIVPRIMNKNLKH